jgi:hypothetical protein
MKTNSDGSICYVPERFPNNWYRRSTPYGATQLIANLLPTYLTGPGLNLPQPLGVLQNPAQAPQIGCAIYQGLTGGVPASILGSTNEYASAVTEYLRKNIAPILPVSLSSRVYDYADCSAPLWMRPQPELPPGDRTKRRTIQYRLC